MLTFQKSDASNYHIVADLINSTKDIIKIYQASDIQNSCHYVVKHKNSVVGCIGLIDRGYHLAEVIHIRVIPTMRKNGLGFFLLDNLINSTRKPIFISYINKNNIPSIALHEKYGFTKIHNFKNSLGSQIDSYIYKK